MEDRKPHSTTLHLDLNNFDSKDAEGSRYVLTSPRSLESCTTLGVRPVELLYKSLSEFAKEHKDAPAESVIVLYKSYEKERRRLLRLCRDERNRLIEEGEGDKLSLKTFLDTVPEQTTESQSLESQLEMPDGADTSGLAGCTSLAKQGPGTLGSKNNYISLNHRNFSTEWSGVGCEGHSMSKFSLGDPRLSEDASRKLNRLMKTMSHKDRKIAAVMLLKHEEEQLHLQRREQEERKREEVRRQEAVWRDVAEQRHRKELEHRNKLWQEALQARRRRREQDELWRASEREVQQALREERWRQLAEEQAGQHQQRLEASQREAEERKRNQERQLEVQEQQLKRGLEQEVRQTMDREVRASRRKQRREREAQQRVQQENQQQQLRYILLKREVEEQARTWELHKRSTLEERLQRFGENHMEQLEVQKQELRERAARGEELSRRARLRVKRQEDQKERQWRILAQLGEWRVQQAARRVQARSRQKAQQLRRRNAARERVHQLLRDRLLQEEERLQHQREGVVANKERRCRQLQQDREEALAEAQRAARASSNVREQVKEVIHGRTFDQMALEAEITASMGRCKI